MNKAEDSQPKRVRCTFSVDDALIVKTWDSEMEKLCHKSSYDVIGNHIKKILPAMYENLLQVLIDGKKKRIKNFQTSCLFGINVLTTDIHMNPVKGRGGKVKEIFVVLDHVTGSCPFSTIINNSARMIEIGKMASTLAHGIRNPINSIKGAVVYLTEKYGKEQTLVEFGKIINDEITRLDNFISNFLSSPGCVANYSSINLNDVIKTIVKMIKPTTESQNIKVLTNLSTLPPVVLDPFQIQQAFFNIINNALEAMPNSGVLNIKSSVAYEDDIKYALVQISDTGSGISKKALSTLGKPSEGTDRYGRGYGIFLSREIIKANRGKLLWESVKNKGATFKIYLPIR